MWNKMEKSIKMRELDTDTWQCYVHIHIAFTSTYSLLWPNNLLWTFIWPLSDFHSTLVSNNCSKIIGHTCISYKWAQHISWSQALFHYPLPIIPLPQLWSDSEPVPVSSQNQPLTDFIVILRNLFNGYVLWEIILLGRTLYIWYYNYRLSVL